MKNVLHFIFLIVSVAGLASLEPPAGSVYFGAWYNRIRGDTPTLVSERVNHRPFSIWQIDLNIAETIDTAVIEREHAAIKAVQTDAFMYITLYPVYGFLYVSNEAVEKFAECVGKITAQGTRVFIRYARFFVV
jgi:hypothetical protein